MLVRDWTKALSVAVVFLAAIGLSVLVGADSARAEDPTEMTIKTMLAELSDKGWIRVSEQPVIVRIGTDQSDPVIHTNGRMTVTIPRSGRVYLIFPPRVMTEWLTIEFYFRSPTDYDIYHTLGPDRSQANEIQLFENSDGTYYFDHIHRSLALFPPNDDPDAPILGHFAGGTGGIAELPVYWGKNELYNGTKEYRITWTYGDPSGGPADMIVTWTHPDGTQTIRSYPWMSDHTTDDGIIVHTGEGNRNHTWGFWPWLMVREFTFHFVENFITPGTHRLDYQLIGANGHYSNTRSHLLVVEDVNNLPD